MTNINLEINQGATFRASIYYKNNNSTAVNLAGYSAYLQIRAGYGATSDLYVSLTSVPPYTEQGDITITSLDGGIHIHIPAEVTSTFQFNVAQYDLVVVADDQPLGDVERVASGRILVNKAVTII